MTEWTNRREVSPPVLWDSVGRQCCHSMADWIPDNFSIILISFRVPCKGHAARNEQGVGLFLQTELCQTGAVFYKYLWFLGCLKWRNGVHTDLSSHRTGWVKMTDSEQQMLLDWKFLLWNQYEAPWGEILPGEKVLSDRACMVFEECCLLGVDIQLRYDLNSLKAVTVVPIVLLKALEMWNLGGKKWFIKTGKRFPTDIHFVFMIYFFLFLMPYNNFRNV